MGSFGSARDIRDFGIDCYSRLACIVNARIKATKTAPSPKEFFSKHASDYARSSSHAHGADLELLLKLLEPKEEEVALDVGTGTGFTAMALATKLKQVIATDITKEMLAEADKLSKQQQIKNIRFEIAYADKLPYEAETFDVVTTRRAAHHFDNISGFVEEAARVLKPGGRLGIDDMSPVEGTETFCNEIERLRDNTHFVALTPSEWKASVERAGLSVSHLETFAERISFESWMYPVKMGGREELLVREEWAGADQKLRNLLGFEGNNGVQSWFKTRIVLIAKK